MSVDLPAGPGQIDDGFDRPIKSDLDVFPIAAFLTDHPDQPIFLQDLRPKGRPAKDEGAVRIGQNATLQVKSGPSWLAVKLHPDRFRLTEESVVTIRAATKRDALATIDDCRAPKASVWRGKKSGASTRPPEDPRDVFFRDLERAIGYANKQQLDGGKTLVLKCRNTGEVEKLLQQANSALLPLVLYFEDQYHSKQSRGTSDPDLRQLLARILPKGHLEDMMCADKDHDGPHALLFDRRNNSLIIYCKELAIQRRIR